MDMTSLLYVLVGVLAGVLGAQWVRTRTNRGTAMGVQTGGMPVPNSLSQEEQQLHQVPAAGPDRLLAPAKLDGWYANAWLNATFGRNDLEVPWNRFWEELDNLVHSPGELGDERWQYYR
jgi:hypothetical protein